MRPLYVLVLVLAGASGCYRAHSTSEAGLVDAGRADGTILGGDAPLDARREDTGTGGACSSDDECPAPIASCARARCFDVSCQVVEIPGACPIGSRCDVTRGCVGLPEAGGEDSGLFDSGLVPDSGLVDSGSFRDAALFDAGFPDAAPFDAGFPDAAPFDAGFPDAAPFDAFVPDAFAGDAGPPPTSSAIRCTDSTVLRVPEHPRLDFGPTGTLEVWVRARAAGTIAIKGVATGLHFFTLRIEGTGDAAMLVGGWGVGTDEALVTAPFGSAMGRWAHVALVQQDLGDSVLLSLFLDGEHVSDATVPDDFLAATNSQDFRLCTLDADLDEVRLWRVARDQTSIRADLRRMLPSGIVALSAYWPLEERGQIVLDRSLHGADGVLGETSDVERADPMRISDGAF
jgi:hypothetical protein